MPATLKELAIHSIGDYAGTLGSSWEKAKTQRKSHARRKLRALEYALAAGDYLFRQVAKIEKQWLANVISGTMPYDRRDDEVMRAMYAQWAEPIVEVQGRIAELQLLGRKVEGAKGFARHSRNVAQILAEWPDHRNPRPVRVDEAGNFFEIEGRPIVTVGLPPEVILQAFADEVEGRLTPLQDFLRGRNAHAV